MTQTEMWTKPADVKRRGGHATQMLRILQQNAASGLGSGWVDRNHLEREVGTHNFTARISQLRRAGWVIENEREDDRSYYRIAGKQDAPTTQIRKHCETCRCEQ